MTRHVLTPEEGELGNSRKNARMKVFRYSDDARRLAEETLRREIAEAKAEAATAPLFRWLPE